MFLLCVWAEGYRKILKLSCRPLAITSYKAYLKNKKKSGTSLPVSFSARFLKKNIFFSISYLTYQIYLSGCLYFLRYWPRCVFVYELIGSGFESSWSHLNFRLRACFEQGVPWHSGNYRAWIHSETRTWHDKNIQSNAPYR